MKKLFIIIILSAISSSQCHAQLSLAMAIDHAKTQSPAYKLITTRKDIQRYQYQSFLSRYKPQVTFYGSIPVYNKEYFAVRQPDGSISFLSINQNMSNVGFALQQKIPFTGGSVSLNTQIARFDDFVGGTKQYNAIRFLFS